MTNDPATRSWHFDRRVPLALLATLLIQSGAAIWWASSMNSAMDANAKIQAAYGQRLDKLENGRDDMSSRLVRVETLISGVSDRSQHQEELLIQILQEIRRPTGGP